jgi:putative transposase
MRYPASEKLEIIRTVEGSHLPTKQTLDILGIPRTTFYRWYALYLEGGLDGLSDKPSRPGSVWNRIPDTRRDDLIEFALEHEALSTRELAVKYTDEKRYFVSESSAYRILKETDLITAPDYVVIKAADEFKDKTTGINQMWQTDFTYFKIIGWGWYYLSTILDDYSRYIISWKLCTTMRASDVTETIALALTASGCDRAVVQHKPRLLSDNGSCYISGDLAKWLEDQKMDHVRGAPFHPQTQGKIERWHQTMKNRVLLENYYLPGDLEHQISDFVEYYNNQRYHESLGNVTPADVYCGRDKAIIREREKIKKLTIQNRRLQHQKQAA